MRFFIFIFILFGINFQLMASGVQPEVSVVILNEEKNGGSINVKNTENVPLLLYTKVYNLIDDINPSVIVTQPVVRLEAGQTQRVRFIVNKSAPLQHEHIKRVTFEGISENDKDNKEVKVNIRHDIPLIIVPKGLKHNRKVWEELDWFVSSNGFEVKNNSKQVVRLTPEIFVSPIKKIYELPKTYILPGEKIIIDDNNLNYVTGFSSVEFYPVSRYGIDVGKQNVTIKIKK